MLIDLDVADIIVVVDYNLKPWCYGKLTIRNIINTLFGWVDLAMKEIKKREMEEK